MSDVIIKEETRSTRWIHNPMSPWIVIEEEVIITWRRQDGTIYQTIYTVKHGYDPSN